MDSGARPDHLFQARLPERIYTWLRTQWYEQRVPMNSVVATAVTALRQGQIALEPPAPAAATDQEEAAQRFTVRLHVADYEWLRATAFHRRVSINQLLVLALATQMSQDQVGAARPPIDR
jgi:hypothetical protein